MKVSKDYYEQYCFPVEACRIIQFSREEIQRSGYPLDDRARVAKRLASFVQKNWKAGTINPPEIQNDWTVEPKLFVDWVLQNNAQDKKIRRKDVKGGYRADNLIF